jgi:hypothetical protein
MLFDFHGKMQQTSANLYRKPFNCKKCKSREEEVKKKVLPATPSSTLP